MDADNMLDAGPFFHGTKAVLSPGDFLEAGHQSNFSKQLKSNYVYFTATLDAAVWGAELALGEGPGRIYRVEPSGLFEDDPNVTDKKFPGNPTRSYRTKEPLLIAEELSAWEGHSADQLHAMQENLENLKKQGLDTIIE